MSKESITFAKKIEYSGDILMQRAAQSRCTRPGSAPAPEIIAV
jgi:hypothetical protein